MKTTYCFESKTIATLMGHFYPELLAQGQIFYWEDFVSHLVPTFRLPDSKYKEAFALLLDEIDRPNLHSYIKTIQKIRASLVLSPTDVDYFFSHLPTTQKNEKLRNVLHSYLASPLRQDLTDQVWTLIEHLKSLFIENPFTQRIVFVPGEEPSYLFEELSRSYSLAQGVEAVEKREAWQCFDDSPSDSPKALSIGASVECFRFTADILAKEFEAMESSPSDWVISFSASPSKLRFFLYLLKSRKIPYEVYIENTEIFPPHDPNSLNTWLEKTRSLRALPLKDRLKLGSKLFELLKNNTSNLPLDERLNELFQQERLTKDELFLLQNSDNAPTTVGITGENKRITPAIKITPFHPLQLPPQFKTICLSDDSYLEDGSTELLLEESEMALLDRQGFQLFNRKTKRQRREEFVNVFLKEPQTQYALYFGDAEALKGFSCEKSDIPHTQHSLLDKEPRSTTVHMPTPTLSATQLETYAKCPSQYFFSNRMRLQANKKLWEKRLALLLGSAVHGALEQYFKEHSEIDLTLLNKLFEQSLIQLEPQLIKNIPALTILKTQARKLLSRVPFIEEALTKVVGTHKPFIFEKDFVLSIGSLKFRGKIDRLDLLSDHSILVLDYKTGTVDFSPNQILQGSHFQALLYWLAVESDPEFNSIAGMLFYDLKKGEIRRGLLKKSPSIDAKLVTRGHSLDPEKLEILKSEGNAHIREIADNISSGLFLPTPDSSTCRSCPYPTLCRKAVGYV